MRGMRSFAFMKRSFIILIVPLLLVLLASCTKDDARPSFTTSSAQGYWRGYISTGAVIAILNKADGSSIFYAFLPDLDTATAPGKLYGTYTVTNGVFHADYHSLTQQPDPQDTLSAETIQTAPLYMTGVMVHSQRYADTVTGVNALTFELLKQ